MRPARTMTRRLLLVALMAPALAPTAASAVPAVMPGWPVPAPAGPVLPGPGGGAVTVGLTLHQAVNMPAVAAFGRSGSRRWVSSRLPACGNCDGGQPARANPDGTYGPIGPTGDVYWNVDRRGRIVPGCAGVVLVSGDCIEAGRALAGPAVSRRGVVRWQTVEAGSPFSADFDVWPRVVADAAGTVYVGFDQVIALDPLTGAVRWRHPGATEAVAGLERGVLVNAPSGVTGIDGDGVTRWTLPADLGAATSAIADPARGQVMVQAGGLDRPRVLAVDLATGAIRWDTGAAITARLLSIGASGRRYLAVRRELRALTPTGAVAWRLPLAQAAQGALELSDGTVVVSQGSAAADDGLLLRVDPRRSAPVVRRGSVSTSRRVLRVPRLPGGAAVKPAAGGILTVRVPHRTTVTTTIRIPRRAEPQRASAPVPAGTSYLRFVAWAPRATAATLEIRWREHGRPEVRRIPIRIVP